MIQLDYTLTTTEERLELVNKILEQNPNPNESYLELLSNYLVVPIERKERKEHNVLTNNRLSTVNKHETSYEGLVSQLENGEDGIYNLIDEERGKTAIFQPKVSITKKDLEEIPFLKQIKEAIAMWKEKAKKATGKEAFLIKQTIIELSKDQYTIKNAYRKPISLVKTVHSRNVLNLDEKLSFDEEGYVIPYGCTLCDPKVVSAVLCNYSKLKESCWGEFEGDLYYFMDDFDKICEIALKDYPIYDRIVLDKIDGMQNIDIQKDLEDNFGIKHSVEYISSLWRKKIPSMIASAAEDEYLYWYYREKEKGVYKKCSRCGEIKLAHNKYFSKNKTSKDGYYSICKQCRNKKVSE